MQKHADKRVRRSNITVIEQGCDDHDQQFSLSMQRLAPAADYPNDQNS